MSRALRATFIATVLALFVGWVALVNENQGLEREVGGHPQVQVRR